MNNLKKYLIYLMFVSIFATSNTISTENKILLKVNNEIITTVDILNEIKYLSLVNNDFKNTEDNLKIDIAKNLLIKNKIKEIELENFNLTFQLKDESFNNIIKSYFVNLDFSSIYELESFFKKKNIDPSYVKQKIITDIKWNRLIYEKFIDKVKINKNEIKKNISKQQKIKKYLLSEILISADNSDKFKEKIKLIKEKITEKSFNYAALTYSASESSKNGGNIGWVKENVLNSKIRQELENINIGEITNPIIIPGGFLILKIEDVNEIENKIDLNKEIKHIIEKKTNEQLNRYSNVYLNKIRQNIKINET